MPTTQKMNLSLFGSQWESCL